MSPKPLLADRLAAELNLSELLSACLVNRGISGLEEAARFLDPRLRQLGDPFLLPNMGAAVDRLFAARERNERVVIFGDYDVDGVTSTALLIEVLHTLGWQVESYLPHRLDEGYGLSRDGVENCLEKFTAALLLAVDCGSTATDTIAWLRQRGLDVIVLDHHQVSDPRPSAVAIVNPHLAAGDARIEPARHLCSAGLAFKLAHALVKRGRDRGEPAARGFDLRPLLDLVALGTVADLVPLTGENRILASTGLARLNQTRRPGLVALKTVAQTGVVGIYEVGFQLAPRLNAAGRLETAMDALHLLMAPDLGTAEPLARGLDQRNRERQQIERNIADEVIGAVRARFNPETDYVIVEGRLLWHIGVVGIVASRVLREFYRPTIILGGDSDQWRGSGRSIEGFDLASALRACGDLLVRHGGHAMAAGLSILPGNLDAFRSRLNELARGSLRPDQLRPALRLDAEVMLSGLTLEQVAELSRLEPIGQGNPPVQLCVRGLSLRYPAQRMGRDQQHLKLWVTDGTTILEAVLWNCPAASEPSTARFDLVFVPQINSFNGRTSVQLKVLDWQPAA
jgi:single-stranded-DNA-specific exonuclease